MSLLLLLSGGQVYTATATDPVGLLDSAAPAAGYGPAPVDPVGVSDSLDVPWWTASLGTSRSGLSRVVLGFESSRAQTASLTDPLNLIDNASIPAGQSFTDTEGLVDSAAQVAGYAQAPGDPVGLVDAATQTASYPRAATDPVGLSDSASQAAAATQTATDPLGVADSATAAADAPRSQTDLLGLVDSAARVLAAQPTATDPVGLLDSMAQEAAQERRPTDSLGLVDSLEFEAAYAPEVTDPVGLLDDAGPSFDWAVETTDPVGLVDDVVAEYGLGLEVTDPLGLADATDFPWWTTVLGTARSGLSRIVLGFAADTSTAADPVGISDTATATTPSIARALTDPLGLHDEADAPTFTAVLGSRYSLLGAFFVLGFTGSIDQQVDKVGLVDTVAATTPAIARTISDPVGAHDELDSPRFTAVLGSEASALRWLVLGFGSVPPQVPIDLLGLADSLELTLGQHLQLDDTLGLADSLETLAAEAFEATATDPVGLADNLDLVADISLELDDPVGVADDVAAVRDDLAAAATDNLGLVDDTAAVLIASHPGNVTVTVTGGDGLTVTVRRAGDRVTLRTAPANRLTVTLAAADLDLETRRDDDLLVSLSP